LKQSVYELNRAFAKEEVQMAKKHMKKFSISHGQKGNGNQNHSRSMSLLLDSYHQEHKQQQMLERMQGEKEALIHC
jgi:hypothetical protein